MKAKNALNLCSYMCRKTYYLTHPWIFIKETYWNVRNFWHRGKYGYAYVDVWEWCSWWPKVGAAALKYMAEHNSGYPSYEPWETMEQWRAYLLQLSQDLEKAAESCDIFFTDKENEYAQAFHKMNFKDISIENKILKQKYYARSEELEHKYEMWRGELFAVIGKNLPRYWD